MTDASQESNPRDRLSRPTEPLPDSQADLSQAKGAKEWTQARMPEPEGAVALHLGVRGWGVVGGLVLGLGGLLPGASGGGLWYLGRILKPRRNTG